MFDLTAPKVGSMFIFMYVWQIKIFDDTWIDHGDPFGSDAEIVSKTPNSNVWSKGRRLIWREISETVLFETR